MTRDIRESGHDDDRATARFGGRRVERSDFIFSAFTSGVYFLAACCSRACNFITLFVSAMKQLIYSF